MYMYICFPTTASCVMCMCRVAEVIWGSGDWTHFSPAQLQT